jgi:2-succinyl-5-enolpyruvyl-6-hydroxy-3-cyclohexene-1-carboxylate synthase
VLTADRPPELRGTGANQVIDQLGLYGSAVRFFAEVGTPVAEPGMVEYWRSVAARAVHAAVNQAGPVHLNIGFREPLVPDGALDWPEPLDGRAGGQPWTRIDRRARMPGLLSELYPSCPERGGGRRRWRNRGGRGCRGAARRAAGWPVLSEPTGNARRGPGAVSTTRYCWPPRRSLPRTGELVISVAVGPVRSRSAGSGRRIGTSWWTRIRTGGRPGPRTRWRRYRCPVSATGRAAAKPVTGWLPAGAGRDGARAAIDSLLDDAIGSPSRPGQRLAGLPSDDFCSSVRRSRSDFEAQLRPDLLAQVV